MTGKPKEERPLHSGRVVRAELCTQAGPDRVYAAFADPRHLSNWFTEGARGEAKEGSTMTWEFRRFGLEIEVKVLSAKPGRLLVLEAPRPGRPPNVLEVSIEHFRGETILRLVNSGFLSGAEWDDEVAGVESGWTMALAALRYYLERRYGERRLDFLLMRPARFDVADAFRRYTTAEGLEEWIAREARFDGDAFEMTLADGRTLAGEVVARSAFEAALGLADGRGVIELKSIRTGPDSRSLAVRASLWGESEQGRDDLERAFRDGLERLASVIGRSV